MTKSEFTVLFAQKAGMAVSEAERLLAALLDSIEDGLYKDGKVALRGFGAFDVRVVKARSGRNPGTGESMAIPESKTVRFKPASSLVDLLN